jgi:hypothetical protein
VAGPAVVNHIGGIGGEGAGGGSGKMHAFALELVNGNANNALTKNVTRRATRIDHRHAVGGDIFVQARACIGHRRNPG